MADRKRRKRSVALFARAEEALLHAAISGSPEVQHAAEEELAKARQAAAKEMTLPKRRQLWHRFLEQDAEAGDPVAAALVGDLTFDEFTVEFEQGRVAEYLSPEEAKFVADRSSHVLRYVLLARHLGWDLADLVDESDARSGLPSRQESYALAARGNISKWDVGVIDAVLAADQLDA